MRSVRRREDAAQAFDACQAEAGSAFGSQEIYCEKFVERARHIEVQVLGDKNGIRVHLGERECSVQRRHQKLLEESPAPNLGAETDRKSTRLNPSHVAISYAVCGPQT